MQDTPRFSLYLRNVIFGIEDGLVSTVGMLSGLAATAIGNREIILTGVIYVIVEAFSMAVGSFLGEESAGEYDQRTNALIISLAGSGAMFVSSIIAGLVPVLPYMFLPAGQALPASMGASVLLLGIVGGIQGLISKRRVLPRVLRMAFLGGAAIVIGIIVGKFLMP